jgi:multiple antibiotic resistance protein
MNWDTIVKEFITLWVVIDPIGSIPVFIAVTVGLQASMQNKIALKACAFAAAILLFFLLLGQVLLEKLSISLVSFQIAGGIVLFLFALTMIFGDSKPEEETKKIQGDISHLAIFPLAIPSLASPGAMLSIVMLTDNHRHSILEQFITALIMLSVILVTLILFFMAGPIQRFLGIAGASIISRVMGLILASVAVDNILKGLSTYFSLG